MGHQTPMKPPATQAKDVGIRVVSNKDFVCISLFLQDVSHNTSMMLEDLTHLSTLLESVLETEKMIPLKINTKNPPDTA